MKLITGKDGLKTLIVHMFIDPENGFQDAGLTDTQGGVLYVPAGEDVAPIMGKIIAQSRGAVFVIGQDYHPGNHISFMVNHPGIMEYRIEQFKKLLQANGQQLPETEEELYAQCQQPVHFFNGSGQPPVAFPFPEIVLDENRNVTGLKEADGRIRQVRVETSSGLDPHEKDRGRVTRVLDEYHRKTFDEYRAEGRLISTQTLWTKHCVQGTPSCLYPAAMNLPQGLEAKLKEDLASSIIYHRDAATDNEYWIIRKGQDPEIDSYGIGVENDGKTLTKAWDVFGKIAEQAKRLGCQKVVVNGGGLATNFCVEFSLNNTADFLAGHFKMRSMDVAIHYVPAISRGIPIPGGADVPFSLEGTADRLARRGIQTVSLEDVLALTPASPQQNLSAMFPVPQGPA